MTSLINILLIMTHTLPQLPYAEDALAPRMSKETIEYHHGKHQRTYVDNLNKLIAGTPYENMSLEEIIVRADGPIFNNAAQDWNHTFFFFTLSPTPKSMPSGPLAEAIDRDFGSFDAFKEQFTSAAAALFGSGWTWLVKDRDGETVDPADAQCGQSAARRTDAAADRRRVGTCLLHRLPEPAGRVPERLLGPDRLENSRRTVRKIESRPTETQRPGAVAPGRVFSGFANLKDDLSLNKPTDKKRNVSCMKISSLLGHILTYSQIRPPSPADRTDTRDTTAPFEKHFSSALIYRNGQ